MEEEKAYTPEEQQLARIAKALSHPARVAMLNYIAANRQCCFSDILDNMPIAKATVSQHLKELKNSGLIYDEADPPRMTYFIDRDNVKAARKMFKAFLKKKE